MAELPEHLVSLINREWDTIRARTRVSEAMAQDGARVLVDGVPSQQHYMEPYPITVVSGHGARVTDADGNEYADYHLGFGTTTAGHCPPALASVIARQSQTLIHSGVAHQAAVRLAEHLCRRFDTEQVQLTCSGTEATSLALRLARAFTGRSDVIKIEGAYHGATSALMVSTHPAIESAGPDRGPHPVPWGNCHAPSELSHTRVVPFNDLDALDAALAAQPTPAAIIMEPVLFNTGFVTPAAGYLEGVTERCAAQGVVLIADEVKTGLTLSWSGARGLFPDFRPDVHCLGKGLAGGLPIGAVAGRADILAQVTDGAPHFSTFAGNPLIMEAACVVMEDLLTPDSMQRAIDLNKELVRQANRRLRSAGITGYAIGGGLKGTIVLGAQERPRTYREYETQVNHDLGYLLWAMLFARDVFVAPTQDEQWTVSTVHGEREVADYLRGLDAFCEALS